MKTATDLAAVLTVHELDDHQYVLRISDLRWRPLIVSVSKLLTDAKSLIVVTPSDIKVLRVSGSTESGIGEAAVARPPSHAGPASVADPELDDETLAAIRQEEEHPLPNAEPDAEPMAVRPEAGMKVVRRKPNGRPAAGHAEVCGRCRGEGQIRIIEEGGTAGQAPCGVCQGTGTIQRYGSRR